MAQDNSCSIYSTGIVWVASSMASPDSIVGQVLQVVGQTLLSGAHNPPPPHKKTCNIPGEST